MLFGEFYVYVHHEEIAVLLPLGFVLYEGQRIKGVAEIGIQGLFEPVDVLHRVVRVLDVVHVKKPVVLFLVSYNVRIEGNGRKRGEQRREKQ